MHDDEDTEHIPFGLGLDVWLCAAVTQHTNSIKGIRAMICPFCILDEVCSQCEMLLSLHTSYPYPLRMSTWFSSVQCHEVNTIACEVLFTNLLCGCGILLKKLLHWLVVGFPRLLSYSRWHFIGLLIQSPPITVLTTEYNTLCGRLTSKSQGQSKCKWKKCVQQGMAWKNES